jgi:hypothetical protein
MGSIFSRHRRKYCQTEGMLIRNFARCKEGRSSFLKKRTKKLLSVVFGMNIIG